MKFAKPITELPPRPSWLLRAEVMPTVSIKIPKRELEARYFHFAVLPERLFFARTDDKGFIEITAKQILSLEKKLIIELSKQKSLNDCAERNDKGTKLEISGRFEEAITVYEENIKPGCWPAMHSFDRLLVLYRKCRDYKNELRVCKRAVKVFKTLDKYRKRLEKIKLLYANKKS